MYVAALYALRKRALALAATLREERLFKAFNPDQLRDTHGKWTASGVKMQQHKSGKYEVSASYTDAEGYTSTISAYRDRNKKPADYPRGDIFVTDPKGQRVKSPSNWMDYPEHAWRHGQVNLSKDYEKHSTAPEKSHWRTHVPVEHRLAMEAKQQALAHKYHGDYAPLKDQWDQYKEMEGWSK